MTDPKSSPEARVDHEIERFKEIKEALEARLGKKAIPVYRTAELMNLAESMQFNAQMVAASPEAVAEILELIANQIVSTAASLFHSWMHDLDPDLTCDQITELAKNEVFGLLRSTDPVSSAIKDLVRKS